MYWQHLGLMDWIVIGAITLALLAAYTLYKRDLRLRSRRYAAWHRAYFQEGGLVRALISRWARGTASLTDQRSPETRDE